MSHRVAAVAMPAKFMQVCMAALSVGVTSLFVSRASTKNPTRTIVTLLVPMKINPRRILSKLGQHVSKPQFVIDLLTPVSLVLKVRV
jgi:hypothetical protein